MNFKKEREDKLELYLTTVWNEIQWSSVNTVLNTSISELVGWTQSETDNISEYAVEIGYTKVGLGGIVFLNINGVIRAKELSCKEKYVRIKAAELIRKKEQARIKTKKLVDKERQRRIKEKIKVTPREIYISAPYKKDPIELVELEGIEESIEIEELTDTSWVLTTINRIKNLFSK